MSNKRLNELCAVEVMGWKKDNKPNSVRATFLWIRPKDKKLAAYDWNPAEDITDAFSVLWTAASKQRIAQWWEICSVIGYRACLRDVNDGEYFVSIEKSPQKSMCVCALRAVAVKEEQIQEALK